MRAFNGGFFRAHKNYVVGFFVWLFAIASVLILPRIGLFKKKCKSCSEYPTFVEKLSPEQKSRLVLFEAGVIYLGGRFFYLGELSENETDLLRSNLIAYKKLNYNVDEKMRRLIIINSILASMNPEARNLILKNEAVILYKDGDFILVSEKGTLESIHKSLN